MSLARRIAGQPRPRKPHRGGWNAWVPVIDQGGVVSASNQYGVWRLCDGLLVANTVLTVTGTGTAGTVILIELPVPAFYPGAQFRPIVGEASIFNASGPARHDLHAHLNSSDDLRFSFCASGTNLWANETGNGVFTEALANGDVIRCRAAYEPDP